MSSDIGYSRYLREYVKHDGNPPPEVHLRIGQVGGILVPICTSHLLLLIVPSNVAYMKHYFAWLSRHTNRYTG